LAGAQEMVWVVNRRRERVVIRSVAKTNSSCFCVSRLMSGYTQISRRR
jgi:hypothetical protein